MAKSKGSQSPRGSRPGDALKQSRVKLKLSLDRETVRLLKLEAFGRDLSSVGLVVDELVRSCPRRFVLVDRGRGSSGAESPAAPSPQDRQEPRQGSGPLGVVSSDVA